MDFEVCADMVHGSEIVECQNGIGLPECIAQNVFVDIKPPGIDVSDDRFGSGRGEGVAVGQ